jgi:hypothetical protein
MKLTQQTLRKYVASPAAFRADLLIEAADGTVCRFGDVQEPWQAEGFAVADPALMAAAGRGPIVQQMKVYDQRGRGHSKSSDSAMRILWLMLFAARPVNIVCVAVDGEQASLILRFLSRLIRLNGFTEILQIQRNRILNGAAGHPAETSVLEILSSDTASSFGILPTAIFCDELAVWPVAGEELWHSLLSSAAKRPNCCLTILSNAGVQDTWQHRLYEFVKTSDEWVFHSLDGPKASWITEKTLATQRRLLPPNTYRRLWENVWTQIAELGLDPADIEACITQGGPEEFKRPECEYFLSCDLGVVRDHSSVVVIAADPTRSRLRLVCCKSWKPRRGVQVDCTEVERFIAEAYDIYLPLKVAIDPWNMLPTIQRLAKRWGRRPEDLTYSFTSPTNRREMADALLSVFRQRSIELWKEPELIDELHRVQFIDKGGTHFEILATRDHRGHMDRLMGMALALPPAVRYLRAGEYRPVDSFITPQPSAARYGLHIQEKADENSRRFGLHLVASEQDSGWTRLPMMGSIPY